LKDHVTTTTERGKKRAMAAVIMQAIKAKIDTLRVRQTIHRDSLQNWIWLNTWKIQIKHRGLNNKDGSGQCHIYVVNSVCVHIQSGVILAFKKARRGVQPYTWVSSLSHGSSSLSITRHAFLKMQYSWLKKLKNRVMPGKIIHWITSVHCFLISHCLKKKMCDSVSCNCYFCV